MNDSSNDLIAVGKVSGTHGIRGQMRLYSYSGNLESLEAAQNVQFRLASGDLREVCLKKAARHSGKILLTLDGITCIEMAQEFAGAELLLQREQLPQPDADEYYWHDLLGLLVVTDQGQELGKIRDILETGANDVYLVHDDTTRREYLIPAIASVVTEVNLQTGRMTVTPLEGLLDL